MPCIGTSSGYPLSGGPITAGEPDSRLPIRPSHPSRPPLLARPTVLTPLYVKTLVQAAWMISWRARESVMTRW